MSGTTGSPWWSSGADAFDDAADPLAAHREARAGAGPAATAPPAEDDEAPGVATPGDEWGAWGDWDEDDRASGTTSDGSATGTAWDVPWEDWDARDPDPPAGAQRSSLDDAMDGLQAIARMLARRGGRGTRGNLRPHGRDESCRACPWCIAMRSLGDARPEVVEHLDEAMRHLVAAARAWVDAAEHRGGWERIELDEDPS